MSAKERLQILQAKLQERGVQDVKFFFSKTNRQPLSQVETDVAKALEAYIDGRFTALDLENLGSTAKA
jgi:hypothetical protein